MSIRCSNVSRKSRRLVSSFKADEDFHGLFVFQYDESHKVLNTLPGMCWRLHALWAVEERPTGFAGSLPTRRQ